LRLVNERGFMKTLHRINWQVSLSNGETCYEGKGAFEEIPNQLSPWQKLLRYMGEGGFFITSLSLFTDDGRTFNLPSAGKNPKFAMLNKAEKPIDYKMFRAYAREASLNKENKFEQSGEDLFTVAEAIYKDYSLQIWVDEHNTKNCWSLVITNKKNG